MHSLNRRFSSLVALSGLATAAGFASQILVAFYFGTSADLDTYWLALAVATAASFYVHPLRESLISSIFNAKKSNPDQANEVLSAGVVVLLSLSFFAAAFLYLGSIFGILNPTNTDKILFSDLLLAFVPFILLFALSETFNAVLLSLDLALHQALARLVSALCTVACLALLAPSLGIYAMLASILLGQLAVLAVSWLSLHSRGMRWRFVGLEPLRNRMFISMLVSLLFSYLLSQIYLVVERLTMSALQPGALSAFQYATLLVNVMISLIALPLSNLLWPRFLELEASGERSGMSALAWDTAGPVVFVLLALATFTSHAAPEIISLVYERGSFDAGSREQTVAALRLTVFASVPIALVTIALRALMSQGRSMEVASVGVLMALIGMLVLGGAWLMRSLPFAQSHWVIANGCGAFLAWQWIIRDAPLAATLGFRIIRSSTISALAVSLPLLLMPYFEFGTLPWQLFLSLSAQTLIYGSMVLVLAITFRLTSLSWLSRRLQKQ